MAETTELRVPDAVKLEEVAPSAAQAPQPNTIDLPQGDPHAEAREKIALKYEERRQREIADANERMGIEAAEEVAKSQEIEPAVSDASSGPLESPQAVEAVRAVPTAAPSQAAPQPAPPPLHPFQLPDGRTTYVTSEQLNYLAQQGVASLQQRPQPPQLPAPVPQPTHVGGGDTPQAQKHAFDEGRAREIVRRLNYGSPEEQVEAMRDWHQMGVPQPSAPQPDQLAQAVLPHVMEHVQLHNNLVTIATEFPDVYNSRVLSQVAAVQLTEFRQQNMPIQLQNGQFVPFNALDQLNQFRLAANAVRVALGPVAQPAVQTPPATQAVAQSAANQSRIERKRAAPQPPTATDRRLEVDSGPREQTRSEVVNQYRVWRGQQPLS